MSPVNSIVRERPRVFEPEADIERDEWWKDYIFLLMVAGKYFAPPLTSTLKFSTNVLHLLGSILRIFLCMSKIPLLQIPTDNISDPLLWPRYH